MFERLDFQAPRRPDVSASRTLRQWHAEICALTQERWGTLISSEFGLKPYRIEPAMERRAFMNIPEKSIGAQLSVGSNDDSTLIVMSDRLSRVLVEAVLNIQGDDWPEESPLSPGEMSILEILIENIADAISESWPGAKTIPSRVIEYIQRPNRSRLFSPGTDLLVAEIQLTTQYGEETLYWLMPKHPIEDLIVQEFGASTIRLHDVASSMIPLAEKIPAEIVIELGTADIRMSDAAALGVGDVLKLNQSVYKPLTAFVDEQAKWKVNPVTIGTRVGMQVIQMIND